MGVPKGEHVILRFEITEEGKVGERMQGINELTLSSSPMHI